MTFRCVTVWDTLGYFSSPELSVPLFCAPARQATASVCSKKKEGIKTRKWNTIKLWNMFDGTSQPYFIERLRGNLTKHLLWGHFDRIFIAASFQEALLAKALCLSSWKARVKTMKRSLNTAIFILVIKLWNSLYLFLQCQLWLPQQRPKLINLSIIVL